jgi:chromate transporter
MAGALGADEWWVLLGAGLSAWLLAEIRGTATALAAAPLELLFVFLKIGGLLYGSGYVLLALLEEELVTKRAWISSQQLLDAIAIGQATPGPLFSSATVIGWWLDGASGAALATFGIFLPAFVLVLLLARWLPRLTQRAGVRAFLTGVELAALALLMLVTVRLSVTTLQETWTIGLAITGLMLLVRTRLNPTWWILLGALAGWLAGAS